MGSTPGDIFVHRGIANLYTPGDDSMNAVLMIALINFKVKHIIVAVSLSVAGGGEGPLLWCGKGHAKGKGASGETGSPCWQKPDCVISCGPEGCPQCSRTGNVWFIERIDAVAAKRSRVLPTDRRTKGSLDSRAPVSHRACRAHVDRTRSLDYDYPGALSLWPDLIGAWARRRCRRACRVSGRACCAR